MENTQIYSATYSNVPVFEFVTEEGPIMRRKLDGWINATHILKIAKFPKAKRTRILEKDVQTGVHEKVQGGYGKYQGTYVPLDVGAKIAKNFEVYDLLSPIFEFQYVEGKTVTPPPAPKHNHASALNSGKRSVAKKEVVGEPAKKRGRPKRVALKRASSAERVVGGPTIGTFEPASRNDTEQDVAISNASLKQEDLQLEESEDEEKLNGHLVSHNEVLFTSKELFGASRESFEKIVYNQTAAHKHPSNSESYSDQASQDYFQSLLLYFVEDSTLRPNEIPENILNPPQPVSKININQSIDNDGNTIFHWACSMAQPMMIDFLISTFQIDLGIKNNKGETPLMFLVNFTNSFQLKSFPIVLDLLSELILAVDSTNKTVLHHIAMINTSSKNKERCARYYMEILFDKIVSIDDQQKQLMNKFINHQDNDGNTAFHISASLLHKKCIKVFISYHRYIDFGLKNVASYTVEEYLANHNYVLRLDNSAINNDEVESNQFISTLQSAQSFESQLYYSKLAIDLQNSTSNLITEKLGELAFSIDKELTKKDQEIMTQFKVLKARNLVKLKSQRDVLSIFKLDHIIEDLDKLIQDLNSNELTIDLKRDHLIQEEVYRLINDLSFQQLLQQEELQGLVLKWKNANEKKHANEINKQVENTNISETDDDQFALSVELTKEIVKRRLLLRNLINKQLDVPTPGEFKENSTVSSYPQNDRVRKYCKLISICCGMSVNEVENSIDLIEQSLLRSTNN